MAEENDTLKLTSVNYTSDNYLAAKKNEDGSYNVEDKVVFNEDITTPGGDVATKSDLDGKQDQLTPDNAGDNITITGSGSALKINAAGGSSEVKSDTWYCYCDNGELGFGFEHLKNDGILIHNWSGVFGLNQACAAKLVFNVEKSKAEVDYYLNAENTMAQDGTTITGYYKGCCLVCAICPWPANTPVPDTWSQNF